MSQKKRGGGPTGEEKGGGETHQSQFPERKKKKKKKVGIFALEEGSGQALCDCGGGVGCLHDILYHKIDRMFITDVSYLPSTPQNKRQDFS